MSTGFHTTPKLRRMGVVLAFCLVVITGRANITAKVSPETTSRFVYEPFNILLEVNSDITPLTPRITPGGGYSIIGIMPLTPKDQRHRYRIEIVPEDAGTLILPPITVIAGTNQLTTAPLRLPISTPRAAHEMALSTTFAPASPYVDQPVTMRLTWNSSVPFTRCWELALEQPILRDANWDIYPIAPTVPEKQRIGIPISGQRAIATQKDIAGGAQLHATYRLVAKRAGTYPSLDTQLQCVLVDGRRPANPYPSYFDNHFFRSPGADEAFERLYLSSPVPKLTVQALPEADRNARYVAVASNCTVQAMITPTNTTVGHPMLMTITLNDLPFGEHIKGLPDVVLDDLGPEFFLTREPLRTATTLSARSFTYVIRPLRSGIDTVPALALQCFDPEQKRYRTLRTQPLAITVLPDGDQTVYQAHTGSDAAPPSPRDGIRANRHESTIVMTTYACFELMARYAWACWLLPPVLWLALRPWLRRLDRCRSTPCYARAVKAAHRFRRTHARDEDAAWKAYLADRFDLSADAVTFEAVVHALRERECPEALIEAVRERFEAQDARHYAPEGTTPRKGPQTAALVNRVEKTVRILVLTICLLPLLQAHATLSETRFQHAMDLRTEKPDEAQPLFTEAALGFDAERRFVNAGNSWFFAAEAGRALASYRAAQRLRPFDAQVNESIAFIRAQRADGLQATGLSGSRPAEIWRHFCQWSPSLRGGVLTLIYLLGWSLYLGSRIFGKRVPRQAWVVVSIIALVPAVSLLYTMFQSDQGVVIVSAEARLGPGYAYELAYDGTLQPATEFDWLETRDAWAHIRLPDGNTAWLRKSACVKIR